MWRQNPIEEILLLQFAYVRNSHVIKLKSILVSFLVKVESETDAEVDDLGHFSTSGGLTTAQTLHRQRAPHSLAQPVVSSMSSLKPQLSPSPI